MSRLEPELNLLLAALVSSQHILTAPTYHQAALEGLYDLEEAA